MLKNYIKIALRTIQKNKVYACLNILGLSVGLASFFMIFLFLENEFAYDQFHPKADRIYRVLEENTLGAELTLKGETIPALAPAAADVLPEIEAFSRISLWPLSLATEEMPDSTLSVEALSVEEGFGDFFELKVLVGDVSAAMSDPNSILINETRAKQLFGSTGVVGKLVQVNGIPMNIAAIYSDLPPTSSLKAEVIAPLMTMNAWRKDMFSSWNSNYGDQTYFLINENADIKKLESSLTELYLKNSGLEGKRFSLEPITEMHFSLNVGDAIMEKTDKDYILIFSLVAIFILVCSVFNYISLALSQSIQRVKEVGVRKVVGAKRTQLFRQFVTESVVYVLTSYVLALILVEGLTPQLEIVIERKLSFDIWSYPGFLVKGLAFSVVVAFVSALYPAFFVTRFKVSNILKKNVSGLSSHGLLRVISVLQIAVFVVLISVAFTANRQLRFMQEEHLGFDKEQQMIINVFSPEVTSKLVPLQNRLAELSSVSVVSHAESIPTRVTGTNSFHGYDFTFHNFKVDEYFFETMGIELVEGRGFLKEDGLTKDLVIVNETAVKKLEFEGTVIGKTIKAGARNLKIIGVVRDFHYGSKKEPIEATLFAPTTNDYGMLIAKLQGGNLKQSIEDVKSTFSEVTNGGDIDFYFLDDVVDAQYRQENIMIKIVNAFSAMAALVAFIGLFGIAGYSVKRRIKEMGVRKVLGASFIDIQKSLNSANVSRLILAMVLALPLIVYWMNHWLASFAYHIEFPVSLVALAFLLSAVVILITVSFHSIKAYLINPVEVLKDD